MSYIFLEDLKDYSEDDIKHHLAIQYSGDERGFDYGTISSSDEEKVRQYLSNYDIIIAYESVGSWGCDSSSYFLIRNKQTGKYEEFAGSHCSCYGFEGQFEPEETTLEYLKSDKFNFLCGGYDENEESNIQKVKDFIALL